MKIAPFLYSFQFRLSNGFFALQIVYFLQYNVTSAVQCHCIFYDALSDTLRIRGGYMGIIMEEGADTVTYFGGNHGSRV